jgi:hypothetical protein
MLTTARIQHEGVTNRYIDTNTGRRAACHQWLTPEAAGTPDAGLGLRITLVTIAAMPIATQIHNAEWYGEFTPKTIRPEDLPSMASRRA